MTTESPMDIFTPNSGVHKYNTGQRYFPHVNVQRTNMVSKTFIHQGPNFPLTFITGNLVTIFNKRIKNII